MQCLQKLTARYGTAWPKARGENVMSTHETYVGEDGDGPYVPLYMHDLVPVGMQGTQVGLRVRVAAF